MNKVLTIIFLFSLPSFSFSQIFLDESVDDWSDVPVTIDDKGDVADLDIEELAISNDESFLYLKLEFNREILLQNGNRIRMVITGDNFELNYGFGEREGILKVGGSTSQIYHDKLGLVLSPTVSSKIFEIQLSRSIRASTGMVNLDNKIDIHISSNSRGNDRVPDSGNITYDIDSDNQLGIEDYKIKKSNDSELRVCSYNILSDGIFLSSKQNAFTSILRTIDADIYLFQEVYDHTAQQLLIRLEDQLNVLDNSKEWYAEKEGRDLVLISSYPIKETYLAGSSGVFVVDVNGKDMMLCNLHLPCCDKDDERESEIDKLLRFIRNAKENTGSGYQLKNNTPIIIAGDMNLVGNADQVEAIRTGNIFNSIYGPDFEIDWDDDGLTDLMPFTTGRNAMYTWFSEFSAFGPGRLDYFFYSDHTLENKNSYAFDSRGITDVQRDFHDVAWSHSLDASDHFPIVSDLSFRDPVSTTNVDELSISLFPNPSSQLINLESSNSRTEFILTDFHGKKVKTLGLGENDISDLTPGIYLVRSTDLKSGQEAIRKIVVQ